MAFVLGGVSAMARLKMRSIWHLNIQDFETSNFNAVLVLSSLLKGISW